MSTIYLCMIVKDEAAVIDRCLDSARGLIDGWVICDTGSTDGTQGRIENALAGLPGELHERPFRDFGHNRSELMRLARGKADYLLLLDADMTVGCQENALPDLTADSYLLRLRWSRGFEFWVKNLVRGDRDWWYEGVVHEQLMTSGAERVERLDELVIDHHADGGARPDKPIAWRRDRRLLAEAVERDPGDVRAVFYLAQTHRDLGETARAIELYERRAAMGGWDEEVFYSHYQAGALKAEAGNWLGALVALQQARECRPTRLEPLHELVMRLRQRGQYLEAYRFARRGLDAPLPDDTLFIHRWVYEWGLLFEYSISAYWVGEVEEARSACERLLAREDLPELYRAHTLVNYGYCLNALAGGGP